MTTVIERKGVWKSEASGRRKGRARATPKGRQYETEALEEVRTLLGERPRRKDLLIEFLHLLQDQYGHLSARHLVALAHELKLSQAEVYEVATFYAHFDVVTENETPPPELTIRVCDSLSCELAGAQALKSALESDMDPSKVRVLRAPCMGRCDTAPVLEIGHRHVDHATPNAVAEVLASKDFHAVMPRYQNLEAYRADGLPQPRSKQKRCSSTCVTNTLQCSRSCASKLLLWRMPDSHRVATSISAAEPAPTSAARSRR